MQYQPQPITPGLQIQANPRPGISPGVAALMNQRTMPPTRPPVSGGARMAPGAMPVKPGQYAKPMQMPPQMPPAPPRDVPVSLATLHGQSPMPQYPPQNEQQDAMAAQMGGQPMQPSQFGGSASQIGSAPTYGASMSAQLGGQPMRPSQFGNAAARIAPNPAYPSYMANRLRAFR